jgi:hypothetical protein
MLMIMMMKHITFRSKMINVQHRKHHYDSAR